MGKGPWFLPVSLGLGAAGGTLSLRFPASRFPRSSDMAPERATSYSGIGAVWVSGDGAGLFGEVLIT